MDNHIHSGVALFSIRVFKTIQPFLLEAVKSSLTMLAMYLPKVLPPVQIPRLFVAQDERSVLISHGKCPLEEELDNKEHPDFSVPEFPNHRTFEASVGQVQAI